MPSITLWRSRLGSKARPVSVASVPAGRFGSMSGCAGAREGAGNPRRQARSGVAGTDSLRSRSCAGMEAGALPVRPGYRDHAPCRLYVLREVTGLDAVTSPISGKAVRQREPRPRKQSYPGISANSRAGSSFQISSTSSSLPKIAQRMAPVSAARPAPGANNETLETVSRPFRFPIAHRGVHGRGSVSRRCRLTTTHWLSNISTGPRGGFRSDCRNDGTTFRKLPPRRAVIR